MTTGRSLGEFERIATHFAPLAGPEALGLSDDCALYRPPAGFEVALTTDTMVGGVHFFPDDPPGLIARKLLRVNLSDLASMGARPRGYLLASSWRRDTPDAWLADFAAGLKQDQEEFGIRLFGGDTTSTDGPLTLTLTALGEVETGKALRRSGAKAGDGIWVTGSIGDAGLGLRLRQGETLGVDTAEAAFLLGRHRLPTPRLTIGQGLVGQASAAIDISDGLIADLGHICETSGLGARVEAAAIPLSAAARKVVQANRAGIADLLTAGDDYELCFTLPAAAMPGGIEATRIGVMTTGRQILLTDPTGQPIPVAASGFRHF